MGEVKAHDAVVGREEASINSEVGGRSRESLNIDTPLSRIQLEGLEGTLATEVLVLIDEFIAGIVPGASKKDHEKERTERVGNPHCTCASILTRPPREQRGMPRSNKRCEKK